MPKTICFVLYCLLVGVSAQAQFLLRGQVVDSLNQQPVSGVSVAVANQFIATDVNGKFEVESSEQAAVAKLSAFGFNSAEVLLESGKIATINLVREETILHEILIATTSAEARKLLQKVIAKKHENNPLEKLKSFEINSYDKIVITANASEVVEKVDTVVKRKWYGKRYTVLDSSSVRFKALVKKQHLFEAEKVAVLQLSDKKFKETITGARMSGFKTPIYELIAFKLQPFSVYDDYYEMLQTKYISPLNKRAVKDFKLKILDTIMLNGRKAAALYFENTTARKNGLSGVLYCDLENFAVAAAVLRVKSVLDITAKYQFTFDEREQLYILNEKEIKIIKGRNDKNISILGETFSFDPEDAPIYEKRKQQLTDITYLLSRSFYFDAKLNEPVVIKKSAVRLHINDRAIVRDSVYWNKYKARYPDVKSAETYRVLDSLTRAQRIENKLRIGRRLLNGYLPVSFFDIDLRYLLSYNHYEGFRLGFGGVTNEKLSKLFKLDGYFAFGTKDQRSKYSGGGSVRVGKFSNTWIGVGFTDDIREIASTSFAIDKRMFKLYDPRPINISTFYNYKAYRTYVETKIIPKTESIWQFQRVAVTPLFAYQFNYRGISYERFTLSLFQASVQWNPFSEFMQTPTGKVEISKQYPRFTFQVTKSVPNVLESNFNFQKLDLRIDYQKKFLDGQRFVFLFEGGVASGAVPLTHLYNTSPNNLNRDRLLQRVTIAGKNSFETMFFNEFFSSSYAAVHLKHGFHPIKFSRKIKPIVVLVTRGVIGTLINRERHLGIAYKTLENGFIESGVELNQIFSGFGLSGFYRYGPNQLPRFEDNLALKISFNLNLGI